MTQWLSAKEAAEIARYHIEHMRRLIRIGEITGRKIITLLQVNRESLKT